MRTFLNGWGIMRILRFGLGILIVIEGAKNSEWIFVILGLSFALMALFNIGCCGVTSCNTPQKKIDDTKEITYEEL